MVFGNGVKSIQAAAYNGARTVIQNHISNFWMIFAKSSKNSIALFHLGLAMYSRPQKAWPHQTVYCSVAPPLVKTGFFFKCTRVTSAQGPNYSDQKGYKIQEIRIFFSPKKIPNFSSFFHFLKITKMIWKKQKAAVRNLSQKRQYIYGITGYGISSLVIQNQKYFCIKIKLQRVLALCYFWDLEKFALAKNRISKIFILCTQ